MAFREIGGRIDEAWDTGGPDAGGEVAVGLRRRGGQIEQALVETSDDVASPRGTVHRIADAAEGGDRILGEAGLLEDSGLGDGGREFEQRVAAQIDVIERLKSDRASDRTIAAAEAQLVAMQRTLELAREHLEFERHRFQ